MADWTEKARGDSWGVVARPVLWSEKSRAVLWDEPFRAATPGSLLYSFTLTALPATITAGNTTSLTLTVRDAFNVIATGYVGTVQFSSTDTAAVLPVNSTLASGVGTFGATLNTTGTKTVTTTDIVVASLTASATCVVRTQNPATHFMLFNYGPIQTSAVPFNFTVQALDIANNIDSTYAGTVKFSSDNALDTTPANSTLTNGVGIFAATLRAARTTAVLTVTDTVTATISGSSSAFTVVAGPASAFGVSSEPTPLALGFIGHVTVSAFDSFGNPTPLYAGTVTFTSTDGGATLPGDSTLTLGVGVFDISLASLGAQTVTATDTVTGTITGTSNDIVMTIYRFNIFTTFTCTAGAAILLTVVAVDTSDAIVSGYNGTVQFASSDGLATLPGDTALVAGQIGVFATLNTTGTQTVSATDTSDGSLTGTSAGIVVV